MVSGHVTLVRYPLGINVNTPLCQVSTLEFGHGTGARVLGLQGLVLVLGHISGHWVPVCTQLLLVSGSPLLCSRCYKAHVSKWRLTGRNGVTMHTVIYRVLKVSTPHHFVPAPRHWYPITKCG